jgi:hypothetical protein
MTFNVLMYIVHGLFLFINICEASSVSNDFANVMHHLSSVT